MTELRGSQGWGYDEDYWRTISTGSGHGATDKAINKRPAGFAPPPLKVFVPLVGPPKRRERSSR